MVEIYDLEERVRQNFTKDQAVRINSVLLDSYNHYLLHAPDSRYDTNIGKVTLSEAVFFGFTLFVGAINKPLFDDPLYYGFMAMGSGAIALKHVIRHHKFRKAEEYFENAKQNYLTALDDMIGKAISMRGHKPLDSSDGQLTADLLYSELRQL